MECGQRWGNREETLAAAEGGLDHGRQGGGGTLLSPPGGILTSFKVQTDSCLCQVALPDLCCPLPRSCVPGAWGLRRAWLVTVN